MSDGTKAQLTDREVLLAEIEDAQHCVRTLKRLYEDLDEVDKLRMEDGYPSFLDLPAERAPRSFTAVILDT